MKPSFLHHKSYLVEHEDDSGAKPLLIIIRNRFAFALALLVIFSIIGAIITWRTAESTKAQTAVLYNKTVPIIDITSNILIYSQEIQLLAQEVCCPNIRTIQEISSDLNQRCNLLREIFTEYFNAPHDAHEQKILSESKVKLESIIQNIHQIISLSKNSKKDAAFKIYQSDFTKNFSAFTEQTRDLRFYHQGLRNQNLELIYDSLQNTQTALAIFSLLGFLSSLAFAIYLHLDFKRHILDRQKILKATEQFNKAQEITKIGSWELDPDLQQIYWSKEAYRMCGIPDFRPITLDYALSFLLPEYQENVRQTIISGIESNNGWRIEAQLKPLDASPIWVRIIGEIIFENGSKKIFGTLQDITNRKKTEEELLRGRTQLAIALQSANMGFWEYNVITDTYSFDDYAVRICGGIPKNLRDWETQFIHPEDQLQATQLIQDVLHDPNQKVLAYECRIVRPDKSVIWIETFGTPVRDANGTLKSFIGVRRDITKSKESEEKLRKSEERLQMATLATDLGVWEYNPKSQTYTFDDRMFEIYGIPPTPNRLVSIKDWLKFVHPDDAVKIQKHIETSRSQSPTKKAFIEHRIIRADRQVRYVEAHISILRDEHNNPVRLIGTNRDVTEAKKIQETLHLNEERLSLATQAAELAIWDWNLITGKFIYDDRNVHLFQYTREELSYTISDFENRVHPQDIDRIRSEIQDAISSPKNSKLQLAYRIIGIDRKVRHIDTFALIIRTLEGKAFRMIGSNRDVTSSKTIQESLRINEERLTLATQAAQLGIWELNLLDRSVYADDRTLEIFHYTRNEFPNDQTGWLNRLHPDDKQRASGEIERLIQSGSRLQHQYRIIWPDNTVRHVESHVTAIRDNNNKTIRIVGIDRDFTAEKEFQIELQKAKTEAESADRAKSEFLAVMSHEIRTPMNGVVGFCNLLKSTNINPEQKDYIGTIEQCGEDLLTIINDILDYSKIEAGRLVLESIPFVVLDQIREVVSFFTPKADEKRLKLTYTIEPSVPGVIIGDPTRIRQILVNLIGNAIKFTERGEVSILVKSRKLVYPIGSNDTLIEFQIIDTGVGLKPEQINLLFQPFTQADSSTTRKYGGTGLGLAIAKRLVEAMSGSISVESCFGKGSTFAFSIATREDATVIPERHTDSTPSTTYLARKNIRILSVDDNFANQLMMRIILSKLGFNTDFVYNGKEAVAAAEKTHYEIIFMDIGMPVMDGYEATVKIREIENNDPARTPSKIIAITADVMPGTAKRCIELGMNEYISKPVKPVHISQLLTRLLTTKARTR